MSNQLYVHEFFVKGKMERTNENEEFLYLLLNPFSVAKMIAFCNVDLPAINGILSDLEELNAKFGGEYLTDPLNRQNIGRMIKFVMNKYGYVPVRKRRIKEAKNIKSNYFGTGTVYGKSGNKPELSLIYSANEKELD